MPDICLTRYRLLQSGDEDEDAEEQRAERRELHPTLRHAPGTAGQSDKDDRGIHFQDQEVGDVEQGEPDRQLRNHEEAQNEERESDLARAFHHGWDASEVVDE